MEMGGGRTQNLDKQPKESPLTLEESDDIYFRVSKLEDLFKRSVRTVDLFNLGERMEKRMKNIGNKMDNVEERMGHMEEDIEHMEKEEE